jgi:hypothetical protein
MGKSCLANLYTMLIKNNHLDYGCDNVFNAENMLLKICLLLTMSAHSQSTVQLKCGYSSTPLKTIGKPIVKQPNQQQRAYIFRHFS